MKIPASRAAVEGQKCQRRQQSAASYYFRDPFTLYTHVLLHSIFSTIRLQDNSHYSHQLFFNVFFGIVSLPGARYVLHNGEGISGKNLSCCL